MENNHPLVPSSYCLEWWFQDYNRIFDKLNINNYNKNDITLLSNISGIEALKISSYGVPLHPKYTYLWNDISYSEFKNLVYYVFMYGSIIPFPMNINKIPIFQDKKQSKDEFNKFLKINIKLKNSFKIKTILETLLIRHKYFEEDVYIDNFEPFLICLGLIDKNYDFDLNLKFLYPKIIFE